MHAEARLRRSPGELHVLGLREDRVPAHRRPRLGLRGAEAAAGQREAVVDHLQVGHPALGRGDPGSALLERGLLGDLMEIAGLRLLVQLGLAVELVADAAPETLLCLELGGQLSNPSLAIVIEAVLLQAIISHKCTYLLPGVALAQAQLDGPAVCLALGVRRMHLHDVALTRLPLLCALLLLLLQPLLEDGGGGLPRRPRYVPEEAICILHHVLACLRLVEARMLALVGVVLQRQLVRLRVTYAVEEAMLRVERVDKDLVPVRIGELPGPVDDEGAVGVLVAFAEHPLQLVGKDLLLDLLADLPDLHEVPLREVDILVEDLG